LRIPQGSLKLIALTLENIGTILAIITPIGIAIAFFVRLQMKVSSIEERFNTHPLILHYNQYQRDKGVIDYYNSELKRSRVESENA
jgi:hypothetical protein